MRAVMLLATLALAGCGTTSSYRTVNDQCTWARTVPDWNHCVERANAREEARIQHAQYREEALDDAMAAGIIVGNFNQPRSCMNIGGIVTCQ